MNRILILCLSIIVLCAISFTVYVWYNTHRFEESLDETPTIVTPSDGRDSKPLPQGDKGKPNDSTVPDPKNERDTPSADQMETDQPMDIQKQQETVEKDDPITAAQARLDYISKNLHEWGQFSPRAAELIAQLTPTWMITDEGIMDDVRELLEEFDDYHDPRSAAVFVEFLMKSGMWGRPQEEALVKIGPPAVPLLIPYLDDSNGMVWVAVDILSRIGEKHGNELGGAVEYIIIPKLKQLLTVDDSNKVAFFVKDDIRKALVRLEKTDK